MDWVSCGRIRKALVALIWLWSQGNEFPRSLVCRIARFAKIWCKLEIKTFYLRQEKTYIDVIFWVQQARYIKIYLFENLFFLTVFVNFDDLYIHSCFRELLCNFFCNLNNTRWLFCTIASISHLSRSVICDLLKFSSWLLRVIAFLCCRFLCIDLFFFFFSSHRLLTLDLNQIPIFEHASVCNGKCNFLIGSNGNPCVFDFMIMSSFMFDVHNDLELTIIGWNIFLLRWRLLLVDNQYWRIYLQTTFCLPQMLSLEALFLI